ncbi:RloB family protein [Nocardiopsis rhodophaea]|uniref:RloB family protein n=1 Tax=Nocardiopsis rhodophaea TaxID=280238 RepID=A0ABP5EFI8_9ACTN
MARTRGKDDLSAKYANKPNDKRKHVVWVFTEGGRTEPDYIDAVKSFFPDEHPVHVHIANDGRSTDKKRGRARDGRDRKPKPLVEEAIKLKRKLDRESKLAGIQKEMYPEVWCIFDRDQHEGVDKAIVDALKADVKVAFSHPCFELWRLLHHKNFTSTCGGVCDEAAKRLPFAKDRSEQDLKHVPVEEIKGRYAKAKRAAVRMNGEHPEGVPLTKRDPYTDVWRFVEEGLRITSY